MEFMRSEVTPEQGGLLRLPLLWLLVVCGSFQLPWLFGSITLISASSAACLSPLVFFPFHKDTVIGGPPPSGPGEHHQIGWFGVWDKGKDGEETGRTLLFTWTPFFLYWTLPLAELMSQKFWGSIESLVETSSKCNSSAQ